MHHIVYVRLLLYLTKCFTYKHHEGEWSNFDIGMGIKSDRAHDCALVTLTQHSELNEGIMPTTNANYANGGFFRHESFLFKDKGLCVPKGSIRELLEREAHKGGLMGHFGELKTYETLIE
ncbi:hypothetical protein CR513_58447, partial [Mucuna pruriens]